jgi:hypothetical protein
MDREVYVLVTAQKTKEGDVNLFISGVFEEEVAAQENLELVKGLENEPDKHYQVIPFTMNRLYLEKDIFGSTLQEMVRNGEIDYLIGEDGSFVFTAIDKSNQ